jgi:hypothetical protein
MFYRGGCMWSSREKRLDKDSGILVTIIHGRDPVSYREVLRWWQQEEGVRSFFIALLATSRFAAFRWETPPITSETEDRPFEFVLWDRSGRTRNPDADRFAEHFLNAGDRTVVEVSMENEPLVVVPIPVGPLSAYCHLGAFVREAPEAQRHDLWKLVGKVMQHQIRARPFGSIWLSAGFSVPWVHACLDTMPTSYRYEPYERSMREQPEVVHGDFSERVRIARSKLFREDKFVNWKCSGWVGG